MIMTKNKSYELRAKLYDEAVELWGKEAQIMMAIEEMAELTQVLLHYLRKNKNVTYVELASEIADVRIMTEQLINMFSIYDLQEEAFKKKIAKLEMYIKKDR